MTFRPPINIVNPEMGFACFYLNRQFLSAELLDSLSPPILPDFGQRLPSIPKSFEAPPLVDFASDLPSGAVHMLDAKQLKLFQQPKSKRAHGGSLAVSKRRAQRPLSLKQSHHITLKSHHAIGARSLFKHKKMILRLIKKNSSRFHIRVYEYALQGNHIHLLVKAQNRKEMQNFFRVIAGHIAQGILRECPIIGAPGGTPVKTTGCQKNQRKFWSYLLYSRIVSWGREFKLVLGYVQRNTLELLQVIAYRPRPKKRQSNSC